MIDRCYNPKCKEYKYYGAKGVHVSDRWHDFNTFIQDVELIEGWNLDLFESGKLQLDKDIKVNNNYIYSLDTCMWVTKAENIINRPTVKKKMLAIDTEGNEYIFYNQSKFARDYNLQQGHIGAVIRGERPHHKGWTFKVLKDSYELIPREPKKLYTDHFVAYKDNIEIACNRQRTLLLRELNLPESDTNLTKLKNLNPIQNYTFGIDKRERYDYN